MSTASHFSGFLLNFLVAYTNQVLCSNWTWKLEGRTIVAHAKLRSTIMARPKTNPPLEPSHAEARVCRVAPPWLEREDQRGLAPRSCWHYISSAGAVHAQPPPRQHTQSFSFKTPPVKKHAPIYPPALRARTLVFLEPQQTNGKVRLHIAAPSLPP